jgi:hypothetical protein
MARWLLERNGAFVDKNLGLHDIPPKIIHPNEICQRISENNMHYYYTQILGYTKEHFVQNIQKTTLNRMMLQSWATQHSTEEHSSEYICQMIGSFI